MDLDIRLPIGLLFVAIGGLLSVCGLVANPATYAAHALGVNIDLIWGLILAAFGALMLLLAWRHRQRQDGPRS